MEKMKKKMKKMKVWLEIKQKVKREMSCSYVGKNHNLPSKGGPRLLNRKVNVLPSVNETIVRPFPNLLDNRPKNPQWCRFNRTKGAEC